MVLGVAGGTFAWHTGSTGSGMINHRTLPSLSPPSLQKPQSRICACPRVQWQLWKILTFSNQFDDGVRCNVKHTVKRFWDLTVMFQPCAILLYMFVASAFPSLYFAFRLFDARCTYAWVILLLHLFDNYLQALLVQHLCIWCYLLTIIMYSLSLSSIPVFCVIDSW